MNDPQRLLDRLDAIGASLARRDTTLALIGLGSVGAELERLDRYSDLDFFVIVRPGCKAHYLEDLSWLEEVAPVAYRFLNTKDGYKLLFADGVFCEFAVFEEAELATIPFAAARVVWRAAGVPAAIAVPRPAADAATEPPATEWLLGEALTNLYVGLLREQRGERLTALRFIQSYAVDRILALAEQLQPPGAGLSDPFSPERRYESRFPKMAPLLPAMLQGYERNRESARAALAFLDTHFELDAAMKAAVAALCDDSRSGL
jgi:lincosamide nucleotidyltransferase B/F